MTVTLKAGRKCCSTLGARSDRRELMLSDSKPTVEDGKKMPLVAQPQNLISMRRDSADFSSNQFWPEELHWPCSTHILTDLSD